MSEWWKRALLFGAVAVCGFPPLAIGGVHFITICAASALAIALFVGVFLQRVTRERRTMTVGWVGAALLLCTAFIALQLVPLPPGVLAVISPKAHELLEFTLGPFSLYGDEAWHCLSLDGPSSAQELIRMVGLCAAYLAARNGFGDRRDANRVYVGVVCFGVVLVVIGLAQKIAGAPGMILGVYQAKVFNPFFTSTFVNPNHLAGFLGLATPLAFGLALSEEMGKTGRFLLGAAGIVCAVGVAATLSRAGIVALGVGQLALMVLLLRARSGKSRRVLWLAALGVLAIAFGGAIVSERLIAKLAPTGVLAGLENDPKVELWADALPAVRDFWATGAGKGAFSSVFPLYQQNFAQYTYTHVENFPLQTLIDYGAIVGGFLLLALAWRLGALVLRRLSAATAGAAASLLAVLVHNLADYNLEIAGVSFAFMIVLGISLRRDREPTRSAPSPWRVSTFVAAACGVAFCVAVCVAAPYVFANTKERAAARISAAPHDAAAIETAALLEARSHPADYLLFLIAAKRLSEPPTIDLRRAIRFANRALYLNAPSYQPHLVTARILRRLGRNQQAALEYRLVARRSAALLEQVFTELHVLEGSLRLMREVADSPEAKRRLARFLHGRGRHADAMLVVEGLLGESARDPVALELATRVETARKRYIAAEAFASKLAGVAGEGGRAHVLRGNLFAEQGKVAEALSAYEAARRADPGQIEAYLREAELRVAAKDGPRARALLDSLRKIDVRVSARMRFAVTLARAYDLEKNERQALREWRFVLSRQPTHPEAKERERLLKDQVEP